MKKKLVSALLATVMLLTVFPLGALSVTAATYGGLTCEITNGEVTITDYSTSSSYGGAITIPHTLDGYPVTTIGDKAFYDCDNLTSVTIPDSVTSIGSYAFWACDKLTSITLGESVTTIGYQAFFGCKKLDSVTFGNSLTTIGGGAFQQCDSLTSVAIPYGVTSIGGEAFRASDNLAVISIPDSVTSIGSNAFYGTAYYNDEANWESNVLYAGKHLINVKRLAFTAAHYAIKEGTLTVATRAFEHCGSLTSLSIPDNTIHMGISVFQGCDSLTDVYYAGSKEDQSNIVWDSYNDLILNATWHYNCVNPKDNYDGNVTHSVMDTDKGNGLAFRFELTTKGIVKDNKNVMDLAGATINYLGTDCKLIGMGAIVTNSDAEATNLTLDTVNNFNVVDISTVYLQEADEDSCAFASRITNIPDNQLERVIYARPYYVVEVDGEQIIVYDDVDAATCAEYM